MIRLAEGVYSWGYFNPEKKYNFNGFLFVTSQGTLAVDPPPLSADDQAYFAQLDIKPDLIVITNRNHLRSRDWFLSRKPVPTAMHADEVGQVDIQVERKLKEGDVLPGGIRVIHLPGKSPGEIGLYWEARGILMLGDALIAPLGTLKLIPEAKLDDPIRLKASLKKLKDLQFDTLLLADGDPILRNARSRVDDFLKTIA